MNDYLVTLVASCPDEDVSATYRAELLKLSALYGVQIRQLTAGDKPSLTVLPGGGDEAA